MVRDCYRIAELARRIGSIIDNHARFSSHCCYYLRTQSWCLYLSGLGGMVGVLAKTSIIELRANRNICIAQCSNHQCFTGTDSNEGYPFGQSGPRLDNNRLVNFAELALRIAHMVP